MLKTTGRFPVWADVQCIFGAEARRMLPVDPRRDAIQQLEHLREVGFTLQRGLQGGLLGSGLSAWHSKVASWTEDVAAAIERISRHDALWFKTLNLIPPPRVALPRVRFRSTDDARRFAALFCQHDCQLARLQNLLTRYGLV